MSSSLAPWVLLFAGHFLGLVHFKATPTRRQNVLFAAAAAGGLLLIILSRSGHAAVTLAALGVMAIVWALRVKARPQTHLLAIAAAAVVLPFVVILAANMIGERLGGSKLGNSSWEERTSSLVIGFRLLTEDGVGTTVIGVGPGLSSPALQKRYDLEAVWSVLLVYVYETGLLGIAVVAWIGWTLLRTWKSARYGLAFAAIGGVWLVGVTLTTSYSQLLPIWVALGWLTIWPAVIDVTAPGGTTRTSRAVAARIRAPREGVLHYQPLARPARPAWGKMQDSQ
jgi:hypothetical protein